MAERKFKGFRLHKTNIGTYRLPTELVIDENGNSSYVKGITDIYVARDENDETFYHSVPGLYYEEILVDKGEPKTKPLGGMSFEFESNEDPK